MRTFLLAFASVTLMSAVMFADDWAGCPEGTEFDGWADIVSNSPCYNGGVRNNAMYVEGRLPYPVCCAPIGRGRRAAEGGSTGNRAEALLETAPKTNDTLQEV